MSKSIYDSIESAEELLQEVAAHGLSLKSEDICRAQDIFGHSPVKELVRLANDNGRLKDFNGEPDPRGTVPSGRDGLSKYFYQVAFHIWSWEDAVRFYNQNSNFVYIDRMEESKALRERVKTQETAIDGLKRDIEGEHNRRLEAENEMEAANKKLVHLEAEVHDRDITIMELKAKLYDLMMKEQK